MRHRLRTIKKDDLGLVKPLWEKLNALHLKDAHFFKEHFRSFTFEKRCEKLIRIPERDIRIEVLFDGEAPAGYCIATVEGGTGEIESLYVGENLRKRGFGARLVENSLHWFTEKKCAVVQVGVAEGHE